MKERFLTHKKAAKLLNIIDVNAKTLYQVAYKQKRNLKHKFPIRPVFFGGFARWRESDIKKLLDK